MNSVPQQAISPRGRFRGVRQIFLFNWPFYVCGLCALLVGSILLWWLPWPTWLYVLGMLGLLVATWWLLGSLLVSFYVYDVSPLYNWSWLRSLLPSVPSRWANIHASLDETSLDLRQLFGGDSTTIDIYNPATMTEPSIERARRLLPASVPTISADYRHLPFADQE